MIGRQDVIWQYASFDNLGGSARLERTGRLPFADIGRVVQSSLDLAVPPFQVLAARDEPRCVRG